MVYPDYTNNTIVNLSAAILKAFDHTPLYRPLEALDDLKNNDTDILLVIDGLGYEYLQKYGRDSFLRAQGITRLCSVFPSTTASALTTLETGVAPMQHGITGWFMLLKELGLVSAILPFRPRYGGITFPYNDIQRSDIFIEKRIRETIKQPSITIYPDEIVDGKVNVKGKNLLTFKSLGGMFRQMHRAVRSSKKRKYIYAYWPLFDSLCHREGCESPNVFNHFRELDKRIASFGRSLRGTGAVMLITADHGLIDTPEQKIIYLRDHPQLYDTLTLPLCGEPRVAYCYVHPDKAKQFVQYIKTQLNHCCDVHASADLMNRGLFGLYTAHALLKERIGDYILVMKDNYIIKDSLLRETKEPFKANHGGMSAQEMYVPLVCIRP